MQLKKSGNEIKVSRDLNDIPILATLLESQADYLVTGDNDLLCLKQDFSIVTLAEFYKLIK